MDETILTQRQAHILNLINQSEGLSREEIQGLIQKAHSISRPTLIRDLHILLKQGFIRSRGRARAIKYLSRSINPLLRVFSVERYFEVDSDKRTTAKKVFDFTLLQSLYNLFSNGEIMDLKKNSFDFQKETKKLSPDIFKREMERFVIELSWKSSKIEGNTYSLLETESLIKEQKEAKGKTKEEALMILNHKAAFDMILKYSYDFRTISISKINQLHNILIKDLNITTGLRKQAVGITGTTYYPIDNEHQIREALEKTVHIINAADNVFEKALIALCMVSYIQPYADGNKRTARMLTNAILLAHDLYPLSYRSVDEDRFKKALILFYEQGSMAEIKQLFIEQVRFANETYFR